MSLPVAYNASRPGEIFVRSYGWINVFSWDDGFLYDEYQLVTTGGGAINAGTEGVFFRDIQNKTARQTNMSLTSQLPSGWEMIVLNIGVHVQGDIAEADAKAIHEYGYVEFVLDNSAVMKSGPVTAFPSGFGLHGHVDISSNTAQAFIEYGNGLPVATSVPPLSIPIILTDLRTFRGSIRFYDTISGLSAAATIKIQMLLHGFIKQPAM